jgi:hypothetical protein
MNAANGIRQLRVLPKIARPKHLQRLPQPAVGHLHVQFITPHSSSQALARLSSTSNTSSNNASTVQDTSTNLSNHVPPLPIRIALVSTTTALATPSFPALGFLYTILRLSVPDANLRKVMEGRWGTLFSFTTWTILPTLYHGSVASLILPCALSNAVVAGGMYGLIDVASGGPMGHMKQLYTSPLLGSGIGACVGYLAPHYVYGPAMELYGFEGMTQSISYVLNAPLVTEVSIVTGAVAGLIMHPMLYYPIHGVHGVHWGYFSGLALAFSTLGMYYIYYGRETVGLPVPEGSYISAKEMELVNAVLRYNQSSGEVEAYSLQSSRFIGAEKQYEEGRRIAEAARMYGKNGNAVFDDRLLAFIYNYWDVNVKTRYANHVVDIKSTDELKKTQDSLAINDVVAMMLLARQNNNTKGDVSAIQVDVSSILDKIKPSSVSRYKQFTRAPLEETCIAIELLFAIKHSPSTKDNTDLQLIDDLELFIHKVCPHVIIYDKDTVSSGVSIESQLKGAGWKSPPFDEARGRWVQLYNDRMHQMQKKIGVAVVTSSLLSIMIYIIARG